MPATAAQIAANQRNAQRSTGPRTEEGEARSRSNSYKHGLTGAGIALPVEDAAEVAARFDEFAADLKPTSSVARFLVERAALMSIRLQRLALHESATLAEHVRHAADRFDDARVAEARRLFAGIETAPAQIHRQLVRSVEGIECLVDALLGFREALEADQVESWTPAQIHRLDACLGGRTRVDLRDRAVALASASLGRFARLDATDGAGLEPAERQAWARVELGTLLDAEVARLRTVASELDTSVIDLDRAEAAERATFDPAPTSILAWKYEAAADRTFYCAMRDLQILNPPASAPTGGPIGPLTYKDDRLGSFWPGPDRGPDRGDFSSFMAVDPRSAYIGTGLSRTERTLGPIPPLPDRRDAQNLDRQ